MNKMASQDFPQLLCPETSRCSFFGASEDIIFTPKISHYSILSLSVIYSDDS